MVQTTDTTHADMTVDVSIKPEVRGELDAAKLARLLQVLPVITATFARANCLASVSLADRAMLPHVLPSPLSCVSLNNTLNGLSTVNTLNNTRGPANPLHRMQNNTPSTPQKDEEGKEAPPSLGLEIPLGADHGQGPLSGGVYTDETMSSYATPPQSPPRPHPQTGRDPSERGKDPRMLVGEDPNLTLPNLSDVLTDTRSSGQDSVDDPHRVTMQINVRIPEVALDLTYDVSKGRHLVLSVRTLEMQMIFRSKDMQVASPTSSFILAVASMSGVSLVLNFALLDYLTVPCLA